MLRRLVLLVCEPARKSAVCYPESHTLRNSLHVAAYLNIYENTTFSSGKGSQIKTGDYFCKDQYSILEPCKCSLESSFYIIGFDSVA